MAEAAGPLQIRLLSLAAHLFLAQAEEGAEVLRTQPLHTMLALLAVSLAWRNLILLLLRPLPMLHTQAGAHRLGSQARAVPAAARLQPQPAQVATAASPVAVAAEVEPRLTQAQPAQAAQEGAALSS